jgi:hypothetical protein
MPGEANRAKVKQPQGVATGLSDGRHPQVT